MSAFRSLIPNPSKHEPVFDCLATVQCAKMEILSRGDVMLGWQTGGSARQRI